MAVMYVVSIPNRASRPAVLLRESFRENGKVKNRTLANLTGWPGPRVEALRAVLSGATAVTDLEKAFRIVRSRPHGHVAAVVGTMRRLEVPALLAPRPCRERDLVLAMIAEVREAAHRFMEEYQNVGLMHRDLVNGWVKILESYIAPAAFEVDGAAVKKGTWLLAVRVLDDDLWQQVKDGSLGDFSIGGTALRQPSA